MKKSIGYTIIAAALLLAACGSGTDEQAKVH